ncbi:penicillin-binding protein [Terrimonas rubra]|uniref:Penicillin-binding protein n=1 Tax=Terrimonas rubra TaxID=1035890 RepID=A0ABW6A768_9BACT
MEIRKDILWRVYLCFIGMTVLCVFILAKAIYIQGPQGEHWRSMSDSMHQKIVELDADRGTIYSEDGQMLSTSMPQFDIYMDMQADGLRDKNGKIFKENVDSFSVALAGYFGDKTAKQYKADLQEAYKKKRRYYPLRKKMSFEDYKNFRQFPLARLSRNKSGVIVEESSKRVAPFGLLANRTIGLSREFINSDGKVKKMNVGLEMSYDSLLVGQKGQRLVRFITGGAVPVEGFQVEPENGNDLYTTIDVNMQDVTQNALLKMMLQCEGEYGSAILMETKTGKIKAMANLGRHTDGTYWEDDNYALRVSEPGSTIKLVTLLAVLDKGTFKLDDLVEVGSAGRMVVGPRNVNDAERSPKSVLTVKEAFAHSSNVGMSKLAFKAFGQNPTELGEYMKKYGMATKSPIDLDHLPKPRLAPLEKGNGGVMNMITMSFGYAINVSPLQTLTLYNAIANNGKMVKPYLVNNIQQNGLVVKQFEPVVMNEQICKPEVVKAAQASMEAVVTEGTARKAMAGLPFKVAGKTGTAHVADGNIKYGHGVYQASFVGYFPADNPQYSCIVVIRTKPHAAVHYGGSLGGPVFKEIASRVYAMHVDSKSPSQFIAKKDSSAYFYAGSAGDFKQVYGMLNISFRDSAKDKDWINVYGAGSTPVATVNQVRKQLMPSLKGMGLKDALYLLESMGVKVQVKGKGKVMSQSVSPGTTLAKNMTVTIELG